MRYETELHITVQGNRRRIRVAFLHTRSIPPVLIGLQLYDPKGRQWLRVDFLLPHLPQRVVDPIMEAIGQRIRQ